MVNSSFGLNEDVMVGDAKPSCNSIVLSIQIDIFELSQGFATTRSLAQKCAKKDRMAALNFSHLRYFWMVAKTGSIARAAEQLHLTPHSISGQLKEFNAVLGIELFRRTGRNLELTDAGRRILIYADEIFSIGEELLHVLRDEKTIKTLPFRVGVADSVSKSVAYQLLEPALKLDEPVRLICREGRLTMLLADLAIHRLDMIIADRPIPTHLSVRGYNHLLGESGLTVFGTRQLAKKLSGSFPASLKTAPFLLPGEDVTIRARLIQWFDTLKLRPHIVGEFDDSALLKSFGQAGSGFFVAPSASASHVCEQYKVVEVGRIDSIVEQLYAITTEQRLTHPAITAICSAAKQEFFGTARNEQAITEC
jgi:LysR family transcriptional activator of nhaA